MWRLGADADDVDDPPIAVSLSAGYRRLPKKGGPLNVSSLVKVRLHAESI